MTTSTVPAYYSIARKAGYTIRDAPVDPYVIPDPIPQDKEELATLLEAAFPDHPQIAAGARKYGPSAFKMLATTESTMQLFKLDKTTAKQLISVLRAGQFLYAPPVGSVPLIRSIEDVYALCQPLVNQLEEHLVVLLVNKNYQLALQQTIAIGHAAGIGADIAAIVQPSLERKISSFVLVHNHPSGDPTPSPEDIAFTQKLQQATALINLEMLDHVIVAKGGYASALRPQA
ncbi:MAG TPA: JAB domain-containing protein [Verrucomicrobiae bacterium]|nr:JAB domain-containing protein [Verrucomicrobiae bacterium]